MDNHVLGERSFGELAFGSDLLTFADFVLTKVDASSCGHFLIAVIFKSMNMEMRMPSAASKIIPGCSKMYYKWHWDALESFMH